MQGPAACRLYRAPANENLTGSSTLSTRPESDWRMQGGKSEQMAIRVARSERLAGPGAGRGGYRTRNPQPDRRRSLAGRERARR